MPKLKSNGWVFNLVGFSLLTSASLVLTSSCSFPKKKSTKEEIPTPKYKSLPVPGNYNLPPSQQVTFDGENSKTFFLDNNKRILFVKKKHPKHNNAQIYLLNLETKKQTRITYHDGDNHGVYRSPKAGRILYTSTTDEIKEDSTYIRKALRHLNNLPAEETSPKINPPMSEIYQSRIDGGDIERLTYRPKFDGEPTVNPITRDLVFASIRSGTHQLYEIKSGKKKARLLVRHSTHLRQPRFSPDGKHLVWVEYLADQTRSKLILSDPKGFRQITIVPAMSIVTHPTWTVDSQHIIFSSNRDDAQNFELYAINKESTCLKRLTYFDGFDGHPAISPEGLTLAYTSIRSGTIQIHTRPLALPESCINTQP